jgi:hypothetical protein
MEERIFIGNTPLKRPKGPRPLSANIRIQNPSPLQKFNRLSAHKNDFLLSVQPIFDKPAMSIKRPSSPSQRGPKTVSPKPTKPMKKSTELFGVAQDNSEELRNVIKTLEANHKKELRNKMRLDSILTGLEQQIMEDLIRFSEAYEPSLGARLTLDLNKIIKAIDDSPASPFSPKKGWQSSQISQESPKKSSRPVTKEGRE